MSQDLKQGRTKNIVVFGANGGIGADVINRIAKAIASGENYSLTLVSRKGEQYTDAQIKEIIEQFTAEGIAPDADLMGNLKIGPVFDPKNLGALEQTIKGADMVICAAGLPRPSPPPARSALIYPNAPVVKDVAKVMALYSKPETPLLLGTNPLDNTVQIANETLKAEWEKAGRTEQLPKVKVFGMAGTLDEARLRIYTAKTLNKALGVESKADAEAKGLPYIKPQDVRGSVYSQHGPKMAVDLEHITLKIGDKEYKLTDFIAEKELNKKEVTLPDGKPATVEQVIENATVNGGAAIIKGLGRSTQIGAAGQIFALVEDFFSNKEIPVNACVVSGFEWETKSKQMNYEKINDNKEIGYCRPVNIGNGKISIAPFPEINKDLAYNIQKGRNAIAEEHDYYDKCVAAEAHILEVIEKGQVSITRDKADPAVKDAQDLKVEIKNAKGQTLGREQLESIQNDIKTITGANDVSIGRAGGSNLSFTIKSNSVAPLDALAEALGTKVKENQLEIAA